MVCAVLPPNVYAQMVAQTKCHWKTAEQDKPTKDARKRVLS